MVREVVRFLDFGHFRNHWCDKVGLNMHGGPKGVKTRKGPFKQTWRVQTFSRKIPKSGFKQTIIWLPFGTASIRNSSQFGKASNPDTLPIRRVSVVVSVAALRAAGQNLGGSKLWRCESVALRLSSTQRARRLCRNAGENSSKIRPFQNAPKKL